MNENDPLTPHEVASRLRGRVLMGFVAASLLISAIFLQTLEPSSASSSSTHLPNTTAPFVTPSTVLTKQVVLKLPASGHCTILEIGDSLGDNIGYGMSYEFENARNVTLLVRSKPSTGLSNAWFYSWPQHLRTYLAKYHPQLVVVFIGANDEQGMIVNGRAVQFDSPAWRTEYGARVVAIMKIATNAGAAVMWVGMPIMGPYRYSQGMKVLNTIVAASAAKVPRVTYLETWKFVAGPTGQFLMSRPVNHREEVIRHPDGIHFSTVGQNVLGTWAVTELRVVYLLKVLAAHPAAFTG